MSEDRKQVDGELFDTKDPESGSDAASTTKEDEETSKGEESEEALDLDEGTASKEEQKQKQVDTWVKKIESGDASLDDLKKHQAWLKPLLEEKLNKTAEADSKAEELDVEAIVDKKIAEKEDLREFKSIKADLNSTKLSGKQKAELEAEFKDLRSMGFNRVQALEKAMKIAGVKTEVPSSRRSKMTPPRPSAYSGSGEIGKDTPYSELADVSEEKRLKHLKELSDSPLKF